LESLESLIPKTLKQYKIPFILQIVKINSFYISNTYLLKEFIQF